MVIKAPIMPVMMFFLTDTPEMIFLWFETVAPLV